MTLSSWLLPWEKWLSLSHLWPFLPTRPRTTYASNWKIGKAWDSSLPLLSFNSTQSLWTGSNRGWHPVDKNIAPTFDSCCPVGQYIFHLCEKGGHEGRPVCVALLTKCGWTWPSGHFRPENWLHLQKPANKKGLVGIKPEGGWLGLAFLSLIAGVARSVSSQKKGWMMKLGNQNSAWWEPCWAGAKLCSKVLGQSKAKHLPIMSELENELSDGPRLSTFLFSLFISRAWTDS